MKHGDSQPGKASSHNSAFGFGITLNVAYVVVETVFGILVGSTALLADAGHNLSDVLGLVLAWGAAYLARTPVTSSRTYGLRKATVMAAFLNALFLLIAVGAIIVEAIRKLMRPEPTSGTTMMLVAGVGFVINSLTAFLFAKGKERDINIKGAFLHMAADAMVSLGVVGAGLLINLTGFFPIDPIVSLVIVTIVTAGTWGLLKDSFHLSMDAVPKGVVLDDVREYLKTLDGVEEVHDLHVWPMSTTETALTAHLVMHPERFGSHDKFLRRVARELHERFGIEHSTVQIESTAQGETCDDENV